MEGPTQPKSQDSPASSNTQPQSQFAQPNSQGTDSQPQSAHFQAAKTEDRPEQRTVREVLDSNRVILTDSLGPVMDSILDQLIQDGKISREVRFKINAMKFSHSSIHDRARVLLDYLGTQGPDAYDSFKKGLKNEMLDFVLDKLEESERLPSDGHTGQTSATGERLHAQAQTASGFTGEDMHSSQQGPGPVQIVHQYFNSQHVTVNHPDETAARRWSQGPSPAPQHYRPEYQGITWLAHNTAMEPSTESGYRSGDVEYRGSKTMEYGGSRTMEYRGSRTMEYRGSRTMDCRGSQNVERKSSTLSRSTVKNRISLPIMEGINVAPSTGWQNFSAEVMETNETCIMQPVGGVTYSTPGRQKSNSVAQVGHVNVQSQDKQYSAATSNQAEKKDYKTVKSKNVNLLLIGSKGNGKSSTGNTILGDNVFDVSGKGGTKHPRRREKTLTFQLDESLKVKVGVTDTPGVSQHMKEEEFDKLQKAVKRTEEGFDAIVLVWPDRIPAGTKDREESVFESLHRMFGDSLYDHLLIAVTGTKQDGIAEYCNDLPDSLKAIADKCHSIIAFDNKDRAASSDSIWQLIFDAQNISSICGKYTGEDLSKECQIPPGGELRIGIIGKTGSGKSSTGNMIVGDEVFPASRGARSQTTKCNYRRRKKGDRKIAVVDSPGVCDTHMDKDKVSKEIVRIVTVFSQGLHAFLLVISASARFTKEEREAVELLKEIFGEKFMEYVVIVLTHKDKIDDDDRYKGDIKKYIDDAPDLKVLLSKCRGRLVVFNNKTGDDTLRRMQVRELVQLIDCTVANNGSVPFRDGAIFEEAQREKDDIKKLYMYTDEYWMQHRPIPRAVRDVPSYNKAYIDRAKLERHVARLSILTEDARASGADASHMLQRQYMNRKQTTTEYTQEDRDDDTEDTSTFMCPEGIDLEEEEEEELARHTAARRPFKFSNLFSYIQDKVSRFLQSLFPDKT